MRQYQQAFEQLMKQNEELFSQFRSVHDAFVLNSEANKEKFNELGSQVVDIIRDAERRLCATTERGGYSKYSQNLSQKLWNEVKKVFPKIDFVGIK